jgi:hypothetical protein
MVQALGLTAIGLQPAWAALARNDEGVGLDFVGLRNPSDNLALDEVSPSRSQ